MVDTKKEEYKRTFSDKIISSCNSLRYSVTEPIKLGLSRKKYESEFNNSTEENPLISVYIPTYNRGQLLIDRAVKSVLAQTYKNFELIVVGDYCTDNTAELLSEVDDKRLMFYNLSTRGYRYPDRAENHWFAGSVVPANKALEMVSGKWIARIDDDDIWTEDHLEVLLRFAQKENHEFVSASYVTERYGKRVVVDAKNENPRIGGTQTWLYRSYLKYFKYNLNCWRKAWNRVCDTDIQDRMHKAGVRMGFLDKVVTIVVPRPGEDTIGLDAYKIMESKNSDHFKFGSV